MSRISVSRRRSGTAGYSITELMVGTALALIILAAILTAYTFLGRNLTRMANLQQLETASRRAADALSKDVSAAAMISSCSTTQLVLELPEPPPSTLTHSVTYDYNSAAGSLTRTEPFTANTRVLMSNLSTFVFTYFNNSGTSVPSGMNLAGIKSVEMAFTSTLGLGTTGTQVSFTAVSPRVTLRNKSMLVPL